MVWYNAGPVSDKEELLERQYQGKLRQPEEAVQLIESETNVVVPLGCGEPVVLLDAMVQRRHTLRNVRIHQMLPLHEAEYLKPGMERHFRHVSWLTSDVTRPGVQAGRAAAMFGYFHEYPRFFAENVHVDVFMGTVSRMDRHGFFSFGVSVDYTTTAAQHAKKVILAVNPNMPRTHGDTFIHVTQADVLVEDDSPLCEFFYPPPGEIEKTIAGYVGELVEDGSTLALGIGPIPQAVARGLLHKKGLGIHSEFITDAAVDLVEAGAVTNRRKTIHQGKIVCTSALGSQKLYRFIDDNPMIEMHKVSYTNDPNVIARNIRMVAVNSASQVDLQGQAVVETFGPKRLGTGGQIDFARGAAMSDGGKFILVLSSRNKKNQSAIVPELGRGAVVGIGRNDVDYIVTEYGVAKLKGKTARQRAEALIAIAHPDCRDGLKEAAKKLGLTR
ncbi:MAG: acetyl-CoA hydrolase/transferase family protein [Bacillota bacterium]